MEAGRAGDRRRGAIAAPDRLDLLGRLSPPPRDSRRSGLLLSSSQCRRREGPTVSDLQGNPGHVRGRAPRRPRGTTPSAPTGNIGRNKGGVDQHLQGSSHTKAPRTDRAADHSGVRRSAARERCLPTGRERRPDRSPPSQGELVVTGPRTTSQDDGGDRRHDERREIDPMVSAARRRPRSIAVDPRSGGARHPGLLAHVARHSSDPWTAGRSGGRPRRGARAVRARVRCRGAGRLRIEPSPSSWAEPVNRSQLIR